MIYFVSGHRDLTQEEFNEHYIPLIDKVLREDIWADFVVGDWEGCDTMFIEYMSSEFHTATILIYCVEHPRIKSTLYVSYCTCDNYDYCDATMTRHSDFDIAWIRPGREDSHTAKNIKRRYNLC